VIGLVTFRPLLAFRAVSAFAVRPFPLFRGSLSTWVLKSHSWEVGFFGGLTSRVPFLNLLPFLFRINPLHKGGKRIFFPLCFDLPLGLDFGELLYFFESWFLTKNFGGDFLRRVYNIPPCVLLERGVFFLSLASRREIFQNVFLRNAASKYLPKRV